MGLQSKWGSGNGERLAGEGVGAIPVSVLGLVSLVAISTSLLSFFLEKTQENSKQEKLF